MGVGREALLNEREKPFIHGAEVIGRSVCFWDSVVIMV